MMLMMANTMTAIMLKIQDRGSMNEDAFQDRSKIKGPASFEVPGSTIQGPESFEDRWWRIDGGSKIQDSGSRLDRSSRIDGRSKFLQVFPFPPRSSLVDRSPSLNLGSFEDPGSRLDERGCYPGSFEDQRSSIVRRSKIEVRRSKIKDRGDLHGIISSTSFSLSLSSSSSPFFVSPHPAPRTSFQARESTDRPPGQGVHGPASRPDPAIAHICVAQQTASCATHTWAAQYIFCRISFPARKLHGPP